MSVTVSLPVFIKFALAAVTLSACQAPEQSAHVIPVDISEINVLTVDEWSGQTISITGYIDYFQGDIFVWKNDEETNPGLINLLVYDPRVEEFVERMGLSDCLLGFAQITGEIGRITPEVIGMNRVESLKMLSSESPRQECANIGL